MFGLQTLRVLLRRRLLIADAGIRPQRDIDVETQNVGVDGRSREQICSLTAFEINNQINKTITLTTRFRKKYNRHIFLGWFKSKE